MTKKMSAIYFGLVVLAMSLLASTAFASSALSISVKDVDAAARKPFQTGSIIVTAPATGGTFQSVLQVPANQRLVIEHVSGGCEGILYNSGYVGVATNAGTKGFEFLDRTFVASNANDMAIFNIGSQSVRFYADPGDDFGIYVSNDGGQTGTCALAISGYFVNLP